MTPDSTYPPRRFARVRHAPLVAWLVLAISMLLPAAPFTPGAAYAGASGTARSERDDLPAIRKRAHEAFDKRDFVAAEQAWREVIEHEPTDFVPWYNLACIYAITARPDDANRSLSRAVETGFSDLPFMLRDRHLASIRETEPFKRLVEAWPRVLDARIDANLDAARNRYGPSYTYHKDARARLAFVSAFDQVSLNVVRDELHGLDMWWSSAVLGQAQPDPRHAPHTSELGAWVTVFLPNERDYAGWAVPLFGAGWRQVGGAYMHDRKMLAAKDLGSSLRHEYWHVLHWRHMDELGQRHPAWIMEGLCSLVEDTRHAPLARKGEQTPDFAPLPSWRTNMVRRTARSGRLMPWEALFALSQPDFTDRRPLALYAQSRAIFLFLHERGVLSTWYTNYTQSYREDRTGRLAFERTFDKPVEDIERDFNAWARSLPEAPEQPGDVWTDPTDQRRPGAPRGSGAGTLPFNVDPSPGDGLKITSSVAASRRRDVRSSGLKLADVITAIDGQPVRDLTDLARLLADRTPGEQVTLDYRRGTRGIRGQATITLVK